MNRTSSRILQAALAVCLLTTLAAPRAQTNAKPQQFIYLLRVAPAFHEPQRWTDKESALVSRHFERLAAAARQGRVILAGRTGEPLAATFGVVIFEAENEAAAREFMQTDPAVAAGLMSATLHPYTIALQRRARVD
jgi:uncharacterized protein